MTSFWLPVCIALIPFASVAQAPSPLPISVHLQSPPAMLTGSDGNHYLAWELQLTNVDGKRRAITLDRLTVRDVASKRQLITVIGNAAWAPMRAGFSLETPDANPAVIGAAQSATFFAWLRLPDASVGSTNEVEQDFGLHLLGVDRELSLTCCKAIVRRGLTISAPLAGDGWIAANGPSASSDHRVSLLAVDGRLRLGQRFAIDWIQVDAKGNVARGKGKKNEDFIGYGTPALAVADGKVVGIHDGVPQNDPGEARAVKIDYGNIGGNSVILDLGSDVYAGYAHLQPGSLRVKLGQSVKRGEILGLLGNSGNSDAPHLHFQLMDAPSLIDSEGLPFVLTRFDTVGTADAELHVNVEPTSHHEKQTPLENVVVNFR